MSLTGILSWVARYTPVPVVKGIQLGAGLSLIISAGKTLLGPLHWASPIFDNRIWAIFAFLVLISFQQWPRFPYALWMFILALTLSAIHISADHEHRFPWFHLWHPQFVTNFPWLSHSSIAMAIGQLPLTTLNSIVATNALADDLFPDFTVPPVTALGISVGAMNLAGFMFGAMPVCHGSGGLAAQYRFGARSGASIIILGVFKIILGLFFGETLLDLLVYYPKSILGIMVIAAGLELAKVGHSLNHGAPDLWETAALRNDALMDRIRRHKDLPDHERVARWTVMLVTTAGILAFKNDAVGFIAGMLCYFSYGLSQRFAEWRGTRSRDSEAQPLLR
jgi:MFS superfamily sulfate permease-like transporter